MSSHPRLVRALSVCASILWMLSLASGCATRAEYASKVMQTEAGAAGNSVDRYAGLDRQLRRSAGLDMSVTDVAPAVQRAQGVITTAGGYVENLSTSADDSAYVQARVPAAALEEVLARLSELGRETGRRIAVEDVTDQLTDLNATLENKRELRERLRALFERGGKLEDLLRVELELTRVQTEIEQLEATLARVQRQVELASLTVSLERRRMPGPGGIVLRALGDGLGWFFRLPASGLFGP